METCAFQRNHWNQRDRIQKSYWSIGTVSVSRLNWVKGRSNYLFLKQQQLLQVHLSSIVWIEHVSISLIEQLRFSSNGLIEHARLSSLSQMKQLHFLFSGRIKHVRVLSIIWIEYVTISLFVTGSLPECMTVIYIYQEQFTLHISILQKYLQLQMQTCFL